MFLLSVFDELRLRVPTGKETSRAGFGGISDESHTFRALAG
jgi:hypothetical protein